MRHVAPQTKQFMIFFMNVETRARVATDNKASRNWMQEGVNGLSARSSVKTTRDQRRARWGPIWAGVCGPRRSVAR